jgi:hypothetical protein
MLEAPLVLVEEESQSGQGAKTKPLIEAIKAWKKICRDLQQYWHALRMANRKQINEGRMAVAKVVHQMLYSIRMSFHFHHFNHM